MSRRVIIETICDPCLKAGQEVEAIELPPVTLFGNKPRLLALCEAHRAEVYDPFLNMVKTFGQTIDLEAASNEPSSSPASNGKRQSSTSAGQSLPCPDCSREFGSPQGLGAHRYQAHGVTAASKQEAKAG